MELLLFNVGPTSWQLLERCSVKKRLSDFFQLLKTSLKMLI